MTDLDGQEHEAPRQIEDGPVKRPYLSLIRGRKTWSDLRLADGEQYTVGERVDAVELTPEVRAALAAREEPPEPRFTIKAKDDLALLAVDAYRALCVEEGLTEQAAEVVKAYGEIVEWRLWHRDLCHPPDHEHKPVWKAPSSGGAPTVADVEEALGGPGAPLAVREELPRAQRAEQLARDLAKAARCYQGGDVDLDAALAAFDATVVAGERA
jgi:hypothetical protein